MKREDMNNDVFEFYRYNVLTVAKKYVNKINYTMIYIFFVLILITRSKRKANEPFIASLFAQFTLTE